MKVKWVWTIPNVLSLLRIALVPVFAVLYLKSAEQPPLLYYAVGVLVLSGVTDFLDGQIARRFHQVSEIGKLLDPLADKLTQVTVVLCLAIHIPRLMALLVICLIKEVLQLIGGWLLLRRGAKVQGARWYGKISTFVFYLAMALFVVFPLYPEQPLLFGWNMPLWLFGVLIFIVTASMLFAFYRYILLYFRVSAQYKNKPEQTASDESSDLSDDQGRSS
ncbi:MAG: CDP-alcohol phosphatidyltransferase family protein [Clostridia bacterium]|nr:CDP-alcohol phosphatidyltransferase family protein [Clostridia bacterium]